MLIVVADNGKLLSAAKVAIASSAAGMSVSVTRAAFTSLAPLAA